MANSTVFLTEYGPYEFDAVFNEGFDAAVEITSYPTEIGVRVHDHRIIMPMKYRMKAAISDLPLGTSVGSLLGALSNVIDSPWVSGTLGTIMGMSTYTGLSSVRPATALELFLDLLNNGKPFTIQSDFKSLNNMLISRLRYDRDAENENTIVFDLELDEFISLERLPEFSQPDIAELNPADPAHTAIGAGVKAGEVAAKTAPPSVDVQVNNVLGSK